MTLTLNPDFKWRHYLTFNITKTVLYVITNKKLSCRIETARRFVSLNILLSHSRSLKVIRNDTVE